MSARSESSLVALELTSKRCSEAGVDAVLLSMSSRERKFGVHGFNVFFHFHFDFAGRVEIQNHCQMIMDFSSAGLDLSEIFTFITDQLDEFVHSQLVFARNFDIVHMPSDGQLFASDGLVGNTWIMRIDDEIVGFWEFDKFLVGQHA